MNDVADRPQRRERPRLLIAASALAVVAALAAAVVAVGLPGSSAPTAPAGVPPVVDQDDDFIDVGWVAPSSQAAEEAPALGRGFGHGAQVGRITIEKIDGTRLALVTEDGWTRTIDTTGASITRDGDTIGVGGLAVGDEISLRQERQADGTFKVTQIRVILPRISGTISGVTSSGFTLTGRDGAKTTVKTTSSTTYRLGRDKADRSALRDGMLATVTGTRGRGGTLTASSVAVMPAVISGEVTATGASGFTLTGRDGTKTTVKVTSSTTYRIPGVASAKLADVKAEMYVMAQGVRNADGSFTASSVFAGPRGKGFGRGGWFGPGRAWPGWSDRQGRPGWDHPNKGGRATPSPTAQTSNG